MDFLVISGCETHFKGELRPINVDIDKLHTKISALNVDFNGPSFNFLCSRKPAHKSIK